MKVLNSFHDFNEPVTFAAFAAFGLDLLAVSAGRQLVVRNTKGGELTFQHRQMASYLAYVQFLTCPTDRRRTDAVLAATSDGQLLQIDIESQRFRRMLERDLTSTDADAVGKSGVSNDSRIGFDPSEKHTLAAGENYSVILNHGPEDNTPVNATTFLGHTDAIYSGAISPDLRRAVTSSADRTIRIWDVRTGIELLSLPIGYTRSRRPEPQGMSINESKIELLLTASRTRTLSREEVLRLPDAAENANYRVSSHTVVQWGDFRQGIVPKALTHFD
ncbi:WD40 repeat domain-containing protein [Fuerstiella marisgermanici]|nr:hypothetical protein [Fuerstiella marisgermanici]